MTPPPADRGWSPMAGMRLRPPCLRAARPDQTLYLSEGVGHRIGRSLSSSGSSIRGCMPSLPPDWNEPSTKPAYIATRLQLHAPVDASGSHQARTGVRMSFAEISGLAWPSQVQLLAQHDELVDVNAVLTGVIGVVGTLLGSFVTYVFQSRTAARAAKPSPPARNGFVRNSSARVVPTLLPFPATVQVIRRGSQRRSRCDGGRAPRPPRATRSHLWHAPHQSRASVTGFPRSETQPRESGPARPRGGTHKTTSRLLLSSGSRFSTSIRSAFSPVSSRFPSA